MYRTSSTSFKCPIVPRPPSKPSAWAWLSKRRAVHFLLVLLLLAGLVGAGSPVATHAASRPTQPRVNCAPRPCRDLPPRPGAAYRISGTAVQRTVDGGMHWSNVLTPGGHPLQRDRQNCAPARYTTIVTIMLDRRADDTLY